MRRIRKAGAGVALALAAAAAGALPAAGHASIPAAAGFGFAPNPAGGTGALGATPPYSPNAFTTIYLRVPFEQTVPFGGSDDTTVDLQAIVPTGWTNPSCGPAKTQLNTAATNNTNQPGIDVPGWSCEILTVSGHSVLHWFGPQVVAPANSSDSPQFFVFSVTTPAPAAQTTYDGTNGTEGFIVDQRYASGETVHWIPNAAYPGTAPIGAQTTVASGLVRTVAGAGTSFHSVAPTRVLDTRDGTGGWAGRLTSGLGLLTVTGGPAAVPVGAQAVVLNITATGADAASYLTIFPAGATKPNASSLNFVAGQTVANLVIVKVGTNGQIAIANAAGSVDVIGDIVGYFDTTAGDKHNALTPARVLDSRSGVGGWSSLAAGSPNTVAVRGVSGVPSTADAVVVNVTATDGSAVSFLQVYASGGAAPATSTLNFTSGQTVANLAVVPIGADGRIAFNTGAGTVDVIADVVGYYDPTGGDLFHPVAPGRVLDSRTATGGWNAPLTAGTATGVPVRGMAGVRLDASAVVANVTATNATSVSYLSVFGSGAAAPATSTLNLTAGATVANLVDVKIGSGGQVSVFNALGTADVLLDVAGYFAAR